MTKFHASMLMAVLCVFSGSVMSQTSFLIKSFETPTLGQLYTYNAGTPAFPGDENYPPRPAIPPSYSKDSGSHIGGYRLIQIKTLAPFNCAGTSTDNARLVVETGGDLAFIMVSEIVNAAKFGYQIQSSKVLYLDPSISSGVTGMGCQVEKISIKVQ